MGNHTDALLTVTLFLAFASLAHFNVVKAYTCIHRISVKTGDVDSAGTDAQVTLKLYDAQGHKIESANLTKNGIMPQILQPYDYFERNQLDYFIIISKCHTSKLCKLELSHDNSGGYPGWYVDYVRVQTRYPGYIFASEETMFEIKQWLAKDEESNSLSVQKDLCRAPY